MKRDVLWEEELQVQIILMNSKKQDSVLWSALKFAVTGARRLISNASQRFHILQNTWIPHTAFCFAFYILKAKWNYCDILIRNKKQIFPQCGELKVEVFKNSPQLDGNYLAVAPLTHKIYMLTKPWQLFCFFFSHSSEYLASDLRSITHVFLRAEACCNDVSHPPYFSYFSFFTSLWGTERYKLLIS